MSKFYFAKPYRKGQRRPKPLWDDGLEEDSRTFAAEILNEGHDFDHKCCWFPFYHRKYGLGWWHRGDCTDFDPVAVFYDDTPILVQEMHAAQFRKKNRAMLRKRRKK